MDNSYNIGTEYEFLKIKVELEQLQIPFKYKINSDSAFPSLEHTSFYATVFVPNDLKTRKNQF